MLEMHTLLYIVYLLIGGGEIQALVLYIIDE